MLNVMDNDERDDWTTPTESSTHEESSYISARFVKSASVFVLCVDDLFIYVWISKGKINAPQLMTITKYVLDTNTFYVNIARSNRCI